MPLPEAATARPSRASPAVARFRLPGLALAGLAQALSIAWPLDGRPLWWLQLLSMGALVWLLGSLRAEGAGWRRAGLHAWLFSTTWLTGSFWWLFISMHTYGGLPAPLAAIAVLALAAALGLYYAAPPRGSWCAARRGASLARWSSRRSGRSPNSCAAAGSPAFPGARAAMRTSKGRWPRGRRGSASMASAPSRHS
jgi:apolipoprotein N-acyltransferase